MTRIVCVLDHETGDFSEYSDGTTNPDNRISVSAAAAKCGNYGMAVDLVYGSSANYAEHSIHTFNGVPDYRIRLYLNLDNATFASGDNMRVIHTSGGSGATLYLFVGAGASGKRIKAFFYQDNGSFIQTTVYVPSGWFRVELVVQRATGSTALDGRFAIEINGTQEWEQTGVDIYDRAPPDTIRVGQPRADIDSGTSGTMYIDGIVIQEGSSPEIGDCNGGMIATQIDANNRDCRDLRNESSSFNNSLFGWGSWWYSAGLSFSLPAVPKGATIHKAYINVYSQSADGAFTVDIYGSPGNGPVFDSAQPSLPTTTAKATWSDNITAGGDWYQTVDLKSVVEEIVADSGWSPGSNCVFEFDPVSGGLINLFDYSDSATYAAWLVVEWSESGGGTTDVSTTVARTLGVSSDQVMSTDQGVTVGRALSAGASAVQAAQDAINLARSVGITDDATLSAFTSLVLSRSLGIDLSPEALMGAAVALQKIVDALSDSTLSKPIANSNTESIANPELYGKPNQSRIWWNSYKGRWDALVPKYDGGTYSQSDRYILLDVTGAQTFTAVELEDRDYARADVYWDDAGKTLYVLGSHSSQPEFWRLTYDDTADAYSFAVGSNGSGVAVPDLAHPTGYLGGNSPAVVYVTPNGRIWASVLIDGGLKVQQSTDGGSTWLSSAVNLNSSATVGLTCLTHFEHNGTTYLALFAGENGDGTSGTKFYFWYIDQNADPTVLSNWTDGSANIPAALGSEAADDHVSAAKDKDGNLYFAVKTEAGSGTDPLIRLFKRTPAGNWSAYTVTTYQDTPEMSRPSIVIDDSNGTLTIYVNEGEVVGDQVRRAGRIGPVSLTNLSALSSTPFTTLFNVPNQVFSDVISPRWSVDSNSDVVVMAHNRTTHEVWYIHERITAAYDLILSLARDMGIDPPAGEAQSQGSVSADASRSITPSSQASALGEIDLSTLRSLIVDPGATFLVSVTTGKSIGVGASGGSQSIVTVSVGRQSGIDVSPLVTVVTSLPVGRLMGFSGTGNVDAVSSVVMARDLGVGVSSLVSAAAAIDLARGEVINLDTGGDVSVSLLVGRTLSAVLSSLADSAASLDVARTEQATIDALADAFGSVSAARSLGVSNQAVMDATAALSLAAVLGLSVVGEASLDEALSLGIQLSFSAVSGSATSVTMTLGQVLDVIVDGAQGIDTIVSLGKQIGLSVVSLADTIGQLGLSRSQGVDWSPKADAFGAADLARSVAIVTSGGQSLNAVINVARQVGYDAQAVTSALGEVSLGTILDLASQALATADGIVSIPAERLINTQTGGLFGETITIGWVGSILTSGSDQAVAATLLQVSLKDGPAYVIGLTDEGAYVISLKDKPTGGTA